MAVVVEVINGRLDEALRKLKKKMEASKVLDEYKRRQYYLKPSLAKKEKRKASMKYG